MSWKPPDELPPENPRLERYRRRVGRVRDARGHEGLILVDPQVWWTQVGGALWWRRWSAPHYAAHVWLALPWLEIPFTDNIVDDEILEDELDDWDTGRFMLQGEALSLEWLSPKESQELAVTEFGL